MSRMRLFVIVSALIASVLTWLYLLTQVQPNLDNIGLMVSFFGSFFVWLGGLLSVILYRFKVHRSNREIIFAFVRPSIRQGFLTSGVATLLLIMQLFRIVTTLEVALIITGGVLFEIAIEFTQIGKLT